MPLSFSNSFAINLTTLRIPFVILFTSFDVVLSIVLSKYSFKSNFLSSENFFPLISPFFPQSKKPLYALIHLGLRYFFPFFPLFSRLFSRYVDTFVYLDISNVYGLFSLFSLFSVCKIRKKIKNNTTTSRDKLIILSNFLNNNYLLVVVL